jgi:hypothetical protein
MVEYLSKYRKYKEVILNDKKEAVNDDKYDQVPVVDALTKIAA